MPRGYYTQQGFLGETEHGVVLFASEQDYLDYLKGENDENQQGTE